MAEVKSPVETQFRNPYDSDDALKVDVVNAKDVKHDEEFGGKKPKKTHKRFFFWILPRKHWWYALWATIIAVLLIIFLIVWFVIIKVIFQSFADKVNVSVNFLDIKEIAQTEDVSSMGVEMSLNFRHDLHLSSSTDATTARLLFDGEEFGEIEFPALKLESGEQNYNISIVGDLTVTDKTVFEKMSTAIVTDATVDLAAHAKVTAHGLGLTRSGIKFNRDLTVKGLNNFKNPLTTIEYMDMTVKTCDDDNYYILLNNTVTNVGQMGMPGIGSLNLSVYYNEDYLGYIVSQNASLGVPRGVSKPQFMMTISKSNTAVKTMATNLMESGKSIQYYVRGDNPYTTKIGLLQESLTYLNMHINYTNGTDGVHMDLTCVAQMIS